MNAKTMIILVVMMAASCLSAYLIGVYMMSREYGKGLCDGLVLNEDIFFMIRNEKESRNPVKRMMKYSRDKGMDEQFAKRIREMRKGGYII